MLKKINWQIPEHWTKIECIDMHTGGEPLRIPISGLPEIKGNSVLEKRRYFREFYDHLRTGLMFEPRGHADMYGAIISEASTSDADLDVFFIHNEGYSTMCGHAVIAITKFAFETGILDASDGLDLTMNVPAGKIRATAVMSEDQVVKASFLNVPSYLHLRHGKIELEGIGEVVFDIAFGGAYYAIVDADQLNLSLNSDDYYTLIDLGRRIKRVVQDQYEINHPIEPDLSFLYGTIFIGHAHDPKHHSRNVCIFAEGEVDRSATGSGVSARAALHHAKGELDPGQPITIESILGSTMTVEVMEQVDYPGYEAIIPKVSGSAHFTGKSTLCFDPEDPWKKGFIFR
ncbi:MAG: proline racemase family protein [Bacteroidia bacterium]|nr:proline racemase family protein [Bacteroidia bacterium]